MTQNVNFNPALPNYRTEHPELNWTSTCVIVFGWISWVCRCCCLISPRVFWEMSCCSEGGGGAVHKSHHIHRPLITSTLLPCVLDGFSGARSGGSALSPPSYQLCSFSPFLTAGLVLLTFCLLMQKGHYSSFASSECWELVSHSWAPFWELSCFFMGGGWGRRDSVSECHINKGQTVLEGMHVTRCRSYQRFNVSIKVN